MKRSILLALAALGLPIVAQAATISIEDVTLTSPGAAFTGFLDVRFSDIPAGSPIKVSGFYLELGLSGGSGVVFLPSLVGNTDPPTLTVEEPLVNPLSTGTSLGVINDMLEAPGYWEADAGDGLFRIPFQVAAGASGVYTVNVTNAIVTNESYGNIVSQFTLDTGVITVNPSTNAVPLPSAVAGALPLLGVLAGWRVIRRRRSAA